MTKIKKDKRTSRELFQKVLKKEEEGNKRIKPIGKKKRKREKRNNVDTGKVIQISEERNIKVEMEEKKKKNKLYKKKRKGEEENSSLVGESDQLGAEEEGGLEEQYDNGAADKSLNKAQDNIDKFKATEKAVNGTETRTRKSEKSRKKKKEPDSIKESEKLLENKEAIEHGVYYISSGEEDSSKGVKKWLMEYHQSRPGLKLLQQRIDDFINAHEEKLEQERKGREAEAAKDGWTVVVHHKGRKKTTDSESGVTVGSVAPAVAESLLATKKSKEVKLDFYRFQKREAQRNEILTLQNKFEQDRKRIQQLRAARKFRPY